MTQSKLVGLVSLLQIAKHPVVPATIIFSEVPGLLSHHTRFGNIAGELHDFHMVSPPSEGSVNATLDALTES